MKFTIKLVVGMLLLVTNSRAIHAQAKHDSISLPERVSRLEDYKADLKLQYDNNAGKLEAEIKRGYDEKLEKIDESMRLLKILGYGGLPVTIIGLLTIYFSGIRKARKFVVDKIENVVEHNRSSIISIIESEEYDTKLRGMKKLLVLSPNQESEEKIKLLFTKFRFKQVKYRVVEAYQEFNDFDLIIFNNESRDMSGELIKEYLTNNLDDDAAFVAYTTINLDRDPRLNFSNSPFTLYHSILSTLKYSSHIRA
jgi:hypothetical protein